VDPRRQLIAATASMTRPLVVLIGTAACLALGGCGGGAQVPSAAGADGPTAAKTAMAGKDAARREAAARRRAAAREAAAARREAAAARRLARKNHARERALWNWFSVQKMTPSDLYIEGIEAPESMLKVYSVRAITVDSGAITIATDLYPKDDNENEFAGVCNQVIAGYGATWVKSIEVFGQDGEVHGAWTDEDRDGVDDESGYMACQSDL
jgi:hypothetical protein